MNCELVNSSIKYNFRCLTTPPLHWLNQSNKSNFMTQKRGLEEIQQFKLTKKEIADYLGISTNAVRMSIRGNNYYSLEYRFDGYQNLFKIPARPRVTIVDHTHLNPGPRSNKTSTLGTTPVKSKVNRGATHRGEANYSNNATKMYNEGKILKNIEAKFESPEHKRIFNEMTEAGFKEALDKSRKLKDQEFQKNNPKINPRGTVMGGNPRTHGKYGGMLNGRGLQHIEDQHHGKLARKDERDNGIKYVEELVQTTDFNGKSKMEYKRTDTPDFGWRADTSFYSGSSGRSYYDGGSQREEYAVEFSQAELDRYSKPTERTEFKNKIEEEIYRAKKRSLKDRGTY